MPRSRPPNLVREVTRHGRVVWYVRPDHGKRVRLRAEYGTDLFWDEYRAGLGGRPAQKPGVAARGTLSWLVAKYVRSAEWDALSTATRKQRHAIFRQSESTSGTVQIARISRTTILAGRDRRKDRPHAANAFVKAMRGLFTWALERELAAADPTTGIKLLPGPNDDVGFHSWTEGELERFEARWQLGTRERLAFDLLLYTGLRRGDVVRLGRQHVRAGEFTLKTEKTGAVVTRPILQPLQRSIQASRTGDLTFLVTEYGASFAKAGFGNWFRDACRKAKMPGSAHGLRKAGARRSAENGATDAQLNALYGWKPGSRESAVYTRAADNARLARMAPAPLAPDHEQRAGYPATGSLKSRTLKKSTRAQ